MVDYHDPVTIAQDFETLVKLWHIADGIFIWEFITTLYFEWDMFRGNPPYRWTIWIYSTARVSTLVSIILNMISLATTVQVNCQLWATFDAIFTYVALMSSSLLIVLRVIAVWNREKIVFILAFGIWVTDVMFSIDVIVRFRSTWSPFTKTCQMAHSDTIKLATFAVLFTDVVLLLTMLVGLLRMRLETGEAFGLGRMLWKQGLIWLVVATAAEVPPTVFMILNLNEALTLIPQTPGLIVVTIAATRMYRSLVYFGSSQVLHDVQAVGSCGHAVVSKTRVRSGPIPLSRMEVAVRTERDHFPTSQSSYVTTAQERYTAHKVSLDVDVESGPEK